MPPTQTASHHIPQARPKPKITRYLLLGAGALIVAGLVLSNHGLSPNSTCKQFNDASADQQDAVLSQMAKGRSDSVGTTRLSLSLYCELYPNRPINGIYKAN